MNIFKISKKLCLLLFIALQVTFFQLFTTDFIWDINDSGIWGIENNWNQKLGFPNASNDNAALPIADMSQLNTITLQAPRVIGNLTPQSNPTLGYIVLGNDTNTLTVHGSVGPATGSGDLLLNCSIIVESGVVFASGDTLSTTTIDGADGGSISGVSGLAIGSFTNLLVSNVDTFNLTGDISVASGSSLILTNITNPVSNTLENSSGTLQLTDVNYSGNITGTGTLNAKAGTTLSGTNTMLGSFIIDGDVSTGSTTALSPNANITFQGEAENKILNVLHNNSCGSIGGDTAGTINIASEKTLTSTITSPTTFLGSFSGSGTFTKAGAGVLTLSTASADFSGTIEVSQGTLTTDNPNVLPENGTLNVIGTLQVDHSNTIGGLSGSGTVTIASDEVLAVGDSTSKTYSGELFTNGGLTKQGSGTWTLSSSSTIGGPLVVTGGTLALQDNLTCGSFTGTAGISIVDSKVLTTGGDNSSTTFSGVLSGEGGLTKTGSGTLTLSGNNTYTGLTTISDGMLDLNSTENIARSGNKRNRRMLRGAYKGSITGDVSLGANGILSFTEAGSSTFSGIISGTGSVLKTGAGNVTLTGANTLTGTLNANAGTLTINGSFPLNSIVNVGSNGKLKGSGTLGSVSVSGVMAPGNSIGTTLIAGNYTQANGSTLEIEFNANGQTDLLDISGTATIEANTSLIFIPGSGSYSSGTQYTFLTTPGPNGVSGTFTTETIQNSNLGSMTIDLTYEENSIFFTLFGSNSSSAGFHSYMLSLTRNLAQSTSNLQLSGINQRVNQFLLKARPCSYNQPCLKTIKATKNGRSKAKVNSKKNCSLENKKCGSDDKIITPFIQFGYLTGEFKPTDNNAANRYKAYAPFIGVEFTPLNNLMFGTGFNYDSSNTQDLLKRGSVNANTFGLSFYSEYLPLSVLGVGLNATTGWSQYSISHITSVNDTAKADPTGWFIQAELGLNPMICIRQFLLMPIAKVRYNHVQINSYAEKKSVEKLKVNYDEINSFSGELGASFAPEFFTGCSIIIPQVSITQNIPFNSSKRQVFVQNFSETSQDYVTIDNTNLYYTRCSLALSYTFKKQLNCYSSGSYLINSGMKNTFEIFAGLGFSF